MVPVPHSYWLTVVIDLLYICLVSALLDKIYLYLIYLSYWWPNPLAWDSKVFVFKFNGNFCTLLNRRRELAAAL
jgi:hypothetical protein